MREIEEYSISVVDEEKKAKKTKKTRFEFFEVFGSIVASLVAVALVFIFVFRMFVVDGASMSPTLEDKDLVVVSNIGYTAKAGDIIVLSGADNYNEPIVKRVIAVAGDKVDINFTTGIVTINGKEEQYSEDLTTQQADIAFPLTVPEGTVFVLGDNRDLSLDSRSSRIGCVDERKIVGKVLFRVYPIGDWKVN